MIKEKRTIGLVGVLLLAWGVASGQAAPPPYDEGGVVYTKVAGSQAALYTGRQEPRYPAYWEGHPYLTTDEFLTGTLAFDGVVYPEVWMRLNTHIDELVVLTPDQRLVILLPADRVAYARMNGMEIRRMEPMGEKGTLDAGYYARLREGKYPLWKRARKSTERRTEGLEMIYFFKESVDYYLEIGGRFVAVNSKRALLRRLEGRQAELNSFIKRQQLSFNKANREASILAVVAYYESLNP